LNTIGECYYKLGSDEEALVAWKRSLELFPDQEDLKKRVDGLKKKIDNPAGNPAGEKSNRKGVTQND
jgi:hypothetical protein